MPLQILIGTMLNLVSKTTSVELYKFFRNLLKRKPVSKQAFSSARGKLNAEVFNELNKIFLKEYYREDFKTYKEYLIFAIDGTGLEIPNTKELKDDFGCTSNQKGKSERPTAKSSVMYDIQNGIIVNGVLKPCNFNEIEMSMEHIDKIKELATLRNKKIIILFDRFYPSVKLMAYLKENKIDFIMRSKKNYVNETKVAVKYSKYDKVKTLKIRKDIKTNLWFNSYLKKNDYKLQIRITSGKFSDNQTGIFLTSLEAEKFNREEILELYRNRWKIETNFRHQKETGEFENFASKTTIRLRQEYFCKIYTLNLTSLLIEDAEEIVQEEMKSGKIKSKYNLKVNRNIAFGIVKDNLIRFILGYEAEHFLESLINEISKHTVPIIENRIFDRKFHGRKRKHNIIYRRAS
jgi:hypothetical protein